MKKVIVLSCVALLSLTACKKNDASSRINEENVTNVEQIAAEKAANGTPVMQFTELVHDFGNIGNNEAVETEFEFKNTKLGQRTYCSNRYYYIKNGYLRNVAFFFNTC